MMVFRAGTHKMLFIIANREDPDQTALSMPFDREVVFEILEEYRCTMDQGEKSGSHLLIWLYIIFK